MLPLMVEADVPIRPLEPGTHPGKEERHGAAVRPPGPAVGQGGAHRAPPGASVAVGRAVSGVSAVRHQRSAYSRFLL